MMKINDYPNYGYEDGVIYNVITKRALRPTIYYGVGYVNLCRNGKFKKFPVPKVAFCATHNVSLNDIPKGLQFVFENDGSIRLSNATERNIKRSKTIAKFKASSVEKIDKEIEWLLLQKAFIQGKDVASEILMFLTNTAKEIEPYILKVTKSKIMPSLAKDYILESVDLCYRKIVEEHILVNSPRRWLSFATRNMIASKEFKRKSLVE